MLKFKKIGITYLDVKVKDYVSSDISIYFEQCYKFLTSNSDKRILIHCVLGRSRSATIIVMYLMKKYELDFDDVMFLILLTSVFVGK